MPLCKYCCCCHRCCMGAGWRWAPRQVAHSCRRTLDLCGAQRLPQGITPPWQHAGEEIVYPQTLQLLHLSQALLKTASGLPVIHLYDRPWHVLQ